MERGGFRRSHRDDQYRQVSAELGLGCRSFLDAVCYTSLLLELGGNLHFFLSRAGDVKGERVSLRAHL